MPSKESSRPEMKTLMTMTGLKALVLRKLPRVR
jgi:hypothetical protein